MIKHLLILILVISFGFTASAQNTEDPQPRTYRSMFGKDSTRWKYSWWDMSQPHVTSITVGKDTIIDSLHYKILFHANHYYGKTYAISEDTVAGKVWIWADLSQGFIEKHLAYDFTLEEGDTFRIKAANSQAYNKLGTVDSVRYRNGLKHIYFNEMITFSDPFNLQNALNKKEPFTIIEGIGSNAGISYTYSDYHFHGYLLCSYKDGNQTAFRNVYHSGHCGNPLSIDEITEGTIPTIYPNPANDMLMIDGHDQRFDLMEIVTIDGKVVDMIKPRKASGPIKVDLKGIPSGTYILRFTSRSGITKPHSMMFNVMK